MFKKQSSVEAIPPIDDIPVEFSPFEVIKAHKIITQVAKRGGQPPSKLPKRAYRPVQHFAIDEHQVRIGSVEAVKPSLGPETTERFFALAARLGHLGMLPMQRFHINTETYHPVQVGIVAPAHDSHLVYGLDSKFAAGMKNGSGGSAYTTGRPLLRPGDTSVSFVGIPASGPSLESRMAAGTEILQNRMHVVSVSNEDRHDEEAFICEPFQESLANGIGNMLGHVAAGATYRDYTGYVRSTLSQLGVFGHDLPGVGTVVAPLLIGRKGLYEQIADGEVPALADYQFIATMPDKR